MYVIHKVPHQDCPVPKHCTAKFITMYIKNSCTQGMPRKLYLLRLRVFGGNAKEMCGVISRAAKKLSWKQHTEITDTVS